MKFLYCVGLKRNHSNVTKRIEIHRGVINYQNDKIGKNGAKNEKLKLEKIASRVDEINVLSYIKRN